jgi:hypothetical protein
VTDQPHPIRTHRLDGTPLPAWLDGLHHFDGGELVVHTPDGDAPPRPGWSLVGWSDGTVTVASPTTVDRVYGPDGIAAQLDRVLAAVDSLCREPHPTHDHVCPDDVRNAVRAAIERSSQ